MKTPNKYITIVFVLAVLFAAYELVISPAKKKPASKPKKTVQSSLPELLLPVSQPASLEHLPAGLPKVSRDGSIIKRKKVKNLGWGRDPFLFPEGIEPYKKVTRVEQEKILSRLKVNAILISGKQKVATIDHAPYVVSIGDWIENEQVLEIEPGRIILGKGDKKRELLLEP
ncbi:MAG: hypothetical protein JRJ42_09810 [Deltaproteobacteria bacterium]|nr:hypothetical protein [Deltaproteobacteria bacterium]MBW2019274.1 hypothetical protein [Deltaproteobacteria bacterium]MBW2074105.1 hypothetical protein [Deltaproteobacteria bacterium]RLB82566.1 MAG: hypothetical protein DRH17_05360 [Deltaproteobacteria bacterium]